MAVKAFVGNFNTNTVTGNQAVTGTGFQPKLVIFFMSRLGTTDPSSGGNYGSAIGAAASSTARWAASGHSRDAAATSIADRRFVSTSCFTYNDNGTVDLEADFVLMDANGFTVDITTANATSRKVFFLALGGDDLSVAVGTFNANGTTGNQAVTGVGFKPNVMLFGGSISDTTLGSFVNARLMLGCGVSSTQRWAIAWFSRDAQATMDTQRVYSTTKCLLLLDGAAITVAADFVSQDADGFTVNMTTVDVAVTIGYIAIKGVLAATGIVTQPGATGNQAITGTGFKPIAVIFAGSGDTSGNDGVFSTHSKQTIGMASAATERGCIFGMDEDAALTSVADRRHSSSLVTGDMTAGTPVINAEADYVSHDINGFTVNWTTADATARITPFLALGAIDPLLPAWEQLVHTSCD